MIQHLRLAVVILGLLSLAACEDSEPEVSAFFSCEMSAAFSIERGAESLDAECVVPPSWILVGLPPGPVSEATLHRAGVPSPLVSLLGSTGESSRWCMAREVPISATPVPEGERQVTARSRCRSTSIIISTVEVADAGRVTLSLRRTASGRPELQELEVE